MLIRYGVILLVLLLSVLSELCYSQNNKRPFNASLSCTDTGFVEYETIAQNNIMRLWQRNDGSIAYRITQSEFGLEFPSGTGYSLLYAGGLLLGGLKQGTTGNPDTLNVMAIRFEANENQPGRILNTGSLGTLLAENFHAQPTFFSLPGSELCWPPEAPYNAVNQPLRLSQRDTWTVFNDLNDIGTTEDNTSLSPGFGIEIQRQTFQFDDFAFNNAILIRYVMINRTTADYDSFYIGLWQDPDVGGDSGDDLIGVDSSLSLGYCYSKPDGLDTHPSAYGCLLLQGPVVNATSVDTAKIITINENGFTINEQLNSRVLFSTSASPAPKHSGCFSSLNPDRCYYNHLKGLDDNGYPKPNGPFDLGTFLSMALDQRLMLSSGPFTFAAGDTQEIWYAMIGGMGASRASAVDTVRHYAQLIRNTFYNDMNQIIVSINEQSNSTLTSFQLHQNYPNPFNPTTTITYELLKPDKVTLTIYNVIGQEIRSLVNKHEFNGTKTVSWDGIDKQGKQVSSGVYIYQLKVGTRTITKKMILIR